MEAAGNLVGVLVELTPGVKLGHDDLGRRHALAGVNIGRNTASIVGHGAGAVGIQRHGHQGRMASQRLVDRIVDDLIDHVMQARAVVGVADIHAGTLADGVEPLEDLDGIGTIFGRKAGGEIVGSGHWLPCMREARSRALGASHRSHEHPCI